MHHPWLEMELELYEALPANASEWACAPGFGFIDVLEAISDIFDADERRGLNTLLSHKPSDLSFLAEAPIIHEGVCMS